MSEATSGCQALLEGYAYKPGAPVSKGKPLYLWKHAAQGPYVTSTLQPSPEYGAPGVLLGYLPVPDEYSAFTAGRK